MLPCDPSEGTASLRFGARAPGLVVALQQVTPQEWSGLFHLLKTRRDREPQWRKQSQVMSEGEAPKPSKVFRVTFFQDEEKLCQMWSMSPNAELSGLRP